MMQCPELAVQVGYGRVRRRSRREQLGAIYTNAVSRGEMGAAAMTFAGFWLIVKSIYLIVS
jgi:hypothetical protein